MSLLAHQPNIVSGSLVSTFSSLVSELSSRNLERLRDAANDPRVFIRFRPSDKPFEISGSYSSIRNRYMLKVSGTTSGQSHEIILWNTAVALFQMRNYQGLFQRGNPLWLTNPPKAPEPVQRSQLNDREARYYLAVQPTFNIEHYFVTYPRERRDAFLEDMASMDIAMYDLHRELSKTAPEPLPLGKKDPARRPIVNLAGLIIFSWAGAFSNLHQLNASDMSLNADLPTLRAHLQKRFGWRLWSNLHEMRLTRALLLSAVLMLPSHLYTGAYYLPAFMNAGPEFQQTVVAVTIKNERILGEDILLQYDSNDSSIEDKQDALDSLKALYQSDPPAFKGSRIELLVSSN